MSWATGETPLMYAVNSNNMDGTLTLLAHRENANLRDISGRSALMYGKNNAKIIQALVLHNADVNTKDNLGQTPLMYCANSKNLAGVNLLLAHGAIAAARDNAGHTALDYALTPDIEAVLQSHMVKGVKR